MNRRVLQNKIKDLKKRLEEARKSGDAKRALFLEATINIYTKELKEATR